MSRPRLYDELAEWFPLVSPPADYAEEAEHYGRLLAEAARRPVRTILELGCGGGCNASHLKRRFQLTLTDRSEAMLALSRRLNPECEHVAGDMRSLRLGRRFDTVFVHDAVMYLTNEADLRAAMHTAFEHCEPGGLALFVPDHTRETWSPQTSHGGADGPDRSLRYLEWSWDPDPSDTTYTVDMAFLLRDRDGRVRVEHDRHVLGLFPRQRWLDWLTAAGFAAQHHSMTLGSPPTTSDVFIASRPSEPACPQAG
jgi:trans-aconitate methyltransferase